MFIKAKLLLEDDRVINTLINLDKIKRIDLDELDGKPVLWFIDEERDRKGEETAFCITGSPKDVLESIIAAKLL